MNGLVLPMDVYQEDYLAMIHNRCHFHCDHQVDLEQ